MAASKPSAAMGPTSDGSRKSSGNHSVRRNQAPRSKSTCISRGTKTRCVTSGSKRLAREPRPLAPVAAPSVLPPPPASSSSPSVPPLLNQPGSGAPGESAPHSSALLGKPPNARQPATPSSPVASGRSARCTSVGNSCGPGISHGSRTRTWRERACAARGAATESLGQERRRSQERQWVVGLVTARWRSTCGSCEKICGSWRSRRSPRAPRARGMRHTHTPGWRAGSARGRPGQRFHSRLLRLRETLRSAPGCAHHARSTRPAGVPPCRRRPSAARTPRSPSAAPAAT
eukprot:4491912-Prymnesium_polylepis.1